MSRVSSSASSISHTPAVSNSSWTQVKVQRVFEYSLAAGVAFAACLVTANPPAAILLGLVTIGLSGHAYSLIDYENPKVVHSLREEALSLSFTGLIKKHGWEKLFQYGILDSKAFELAYQNHANSLAFNEILDLDKEARKGLQKAMKHFLIYQPHFEIPSPANWRHRFFKETVESSCEEILNRYPLAKLKEWNIVTFRQGKILDEAKKTNEEFNKSINALEQQYRDEISIYCRAFDVAKALAEATYLSHPAHKEIQIINDLEKNAILKLSQRTKNAISREEKIFNRWLMDLNVQTLSTGEKERRIADRKAGLEVAREQLKQDEMNEMQVVRIQSSFLRQPYNKQIDDAKITEKTLIATAQLIFNLACQPTRKKIDDFKCDLHVDYKYAIRLLTKKYHDAKSI